MKKLLLLVVALSGCSPQGKEVSEGALTPPQFKERLTADVVVVDVRTPEELSSGVIPNALNIDFRATDFEQKIGSLDKSKTYLVYCASGVRSAKAAELMKSKGFASVSTLEGGTNAWSAAGFALEAH